jgi:hypothetical protein
MRSRAVSSAFVGLGERPRLSNSVNKLSLSIYI